MAARANRIVGGALVAVLAVALAAMVALGAGASADSVGAVALVHDSEGAVYELPLSEDSRTTVSTDLGTNVVVVEDGAVFVVEADCENHDCMRQGTLTAPGKQIVCLPHRLWIEVIANGSGDIDVVAR